MYGLRTSLFILACSIAMMTRPGHAVEKEPDGPGYLTDTHGAAGALMSFLEIADTHPEVRSYAQGTVNWLYNVRIRERGGCIWRMSMTAPSGHPSSRISPFNALMILNVLARMDVRWPNPKCHAMLAEGIVMLKNHTKKVQTKSGAGWGLLGSPDGMLHGNGSGRAGPAGVLMMLSEFYDLTKHADLAAMVRGMTNLLKDAAIMSEKDQRTSALWYWKADAQRWQTSWCYGTAGTAWALLTAHAALPEHRFHDGTSILDLGNAGLNWLMSKAQEQAGSITWPNLRAPAPSENTGWGSGAAGVGATFLLGYRLNKHLHPDLARCYLDIARKTARGIASQIQGGWDYQGKSHVVQDGVTRESLNLGLCGGIGGTALFMVDIMREMQDGDRELAEACRDVCETLGAWYHTRSIPFHGGRVWTARNKFGGEKTLNFALDYGLSGMVWCVHALARALDDAGLKALEDDALKAMLSLAVQDADGYKWPLFTTIRPEG